MPSLSSFVTSSAESILNDNIDYRWVCLGTDRNTQGRTPNELINSVDKAFPALVNSRRRRVQLSATVPIIS